MLQYLLYLNTAMKIYDCFTFYNELDLLDIRLAELYNVVDHFVLVEATTTFTNRPKELLFRNNQSRYEKYLDKIIYIPVDLPGSPNPWDNERYQRNAIVQGLSEADGTDIVIVSDCDEIPRAEAVKSLRGTSQTIYAFRMPLFNFKFNYMSLKSSRYDIWAMATQRTVLNELTPDSLRNMRFNFMDAEYQYQNNGCQVIEHSGWHFGYLGDNEYLKDKAQSFSHQEVNNSDFLNQIDVDSSIREGKSWDRRDSNQYEIVDIDSYFPESIKQYNSYILNNTGTKALDYLPKYPYNN